MSLSIVKLLSVLCCISHRFVLVESVTCLSCNRIVQPSDCSQLTECGSHEQCYMKRYVTQSGTTWYDVGCLDVSKCAAFSGPLPGANQMTLPPSIIGRRDIVNITSYKRFTHPPSVIGRREDSGDTVTCEHCCNDKICNKGGFCGAKPLDNPGPVCYSCKDALDKDGCDQIEQCGANENCFIKQELNKVSQEFRWKHGCMSTNVCTAIRGRRSVDKNMETDVYFSDTNSTSGIKVCDDCCTDDLCNNNCSNYVDWNAPVTSPPSGNTTKVTSGGNSIVTMTTTTTELPTSTLDPFITVSCDFENGLCNWHQDKIDDGDWRIHEGSTATMNTGPMVDHTLKNAEGHYLYLEASDLYYQNFVRLVSNHLVLPDNTCLFFWYHMHGNYIGALNIIIKDKNGNEQKMWSEEGNHGDRWQVAKIPLNKVPAGQLIIEGFRGADIYGDISVDDIKLVPGCS